MLGADTEYITQRITRQCARKCTQTDTLTQLLLPLLNYTHLFVSRGQIKSTSLTLMCALDADVALGDCKPETIIRQYIKDSARTVNVQQKSKIASEDWKT